MLSRILRYLMLLAMVVWLGGIIFFGAVMAPVLFHVLPVEWAGSVVASTLPILHWIGSASGVTFLTIFLFGDIGRRHTRLENLVPVLVLLMLLLTMTSQFFLLPKMEELRPIMETKPDFYTPIGRPIEDVQRAKAARTQFDSLHHWSTRIESTVLILGLVALFYFTDPDFAHHKGQEGSQRKS